MHEGISTSTTPKLECTPWSHSARGVEPFYELDDELTMFRCGFNFYAVGRNCLNS